MMRNETRPASLRRAVLAAAVTALIFLFSCSGRSNDSLPMEELFSLGYGKIEDQIDLFPERSGVFGRQSRLLMRDGFFYIANQRKVMLFSSYGDVLGLVYDPDTNPAPIMLENVSSELRSNRRALPFPFRSVGEIAVASDRTLYIEDNLPAERAQRDDTLQVSLQSVIQRFARGVEYRGFLGQEGVGGSPFPFIHRIHVNSRDEVIVVCRAVDVWQVYWFSPQGERRAFVTIPLKDLPGRRAGNISASLDTIVPDHERDRLCLKVDYLRNTVDPKTGITHSVEKSFSRLFWYDVQSRQVSQEIEVPEHTFRIGNGELLNSRQVTAPMELLGISRAGDFYLLGRTPDEGTILVVLSSNGNLLHRRTLELGETNYLMQVFSLSPDGTVSALLAEEEQARIVWWRFGTPGAR